MLEVCVVGAGIVGVSTAIWLQRLGCAVTLVDREGVAAGASFGNGGVLASCAIVPVAAPGLLSKAPRMLLDPSEPLFLRWSYLPKLAPWLLSFLLRANETDARATAAALMPIIGDSLADHQALAAGTGAARWVIPSSYLYVYPDAEAQAADAFSWSLRAEHGFKPEPMSAEALAEWDRVFVGSDSVALKLGGHGRIVDPGAYLRALADHVVRQGGRLVIATAEDVVRENGVVSGLRLRGRDGSAETLACDAVVIAMGAWSADLTRKLGLHVPLESERGYHLDLCAPSLMPRGPVMLTAGKCVVTPMEGWVRVAGIVEFGGLDAPPSQAPFALLRRRVREAMPGLSWGEEREWMGHRPALADSLPVIGEVPGVGGAFLGFGHHHVGLTGGPRTGQLLAQLVTGATPNIDLAPYAPSRFQ